MRAAPLGLKNASFGIHAGNHKTAIPVRQADGGSGFVGKGQWWFVWIVISCQETAKPFRCQACGRNL
ncbi:hypothetical protein CA85_43710 [Allorhodopirellula solitaria]|uniref:Uncharacterized protein n=1 Tax=Allorhodopirellula solitaria TaxID=2527987 RepID=A0A5C5X0I3_9BACT|nr:hypothetical protein CA85_43710 [Allorhodopirellula solitaria]